MTTPYADTEASSEQIVSLMRRINALEDKCYRYVRRWSADSKYPIYSCPSGDNIVIWLADDPVHPTIQEIKTFSSSGSIVSSWGLYGWPHCEDSESNVYLSMVAGDTESGTVSVYTGGGALVRTFAASPDLTGAGSVGAQAIRGISHYSNEIYCLVRENTDSASADFGKRKCVVFNLSGVLQRSFPVENGNDAFMYSTMCVTQDGIFLHEQGAIEVNKYGFDGTAQGSLTFDISFLPVEPSYIKGYGRRIYVVPKKWSGSIYERFIRVYRSGSLSQLVCTGNVGTGGRPFAPQNDPEENGQFYQISDCCVVGNDLYILDNTDDSNVQVFENPKTQWNSYTLSASTPLGDSDIETSSIDSTVTIHDLNALSANNAKQIKLHITDMRDAIENLCENHSIAGTGHPYGSLPGLEEWESPVFGTFFYPSTFSGMPYRWIAAANTTRLYPTALATWTALYAQSKSVTDLRITGVQPIGPQYIITATCTGHGLSAGDSVVIAGASPSNYNGTFGVQTAPSVDTFTYYIPHAMGVASPASGTITCRKIFNTWRHPSGEMDGDWAYDMSIYEIDRCIAFLEAGLWQAWPYRH